MVAAGPDAPPADTARLLAVVARTIGAHRAAFLDLDAGRRPRLLGEAWEAGSAGDSARHRESAPGNGHPHRDLPVWPGAITVELGSGTLLLAAGPHLDRQLAESLAPLLGLLVAGARELEVARAESIRHHRATEAHTDLVSVVSHELRSPLTSILGALQTLQRLGLAPPGSDAARIVDSAARRAERLRALVDDLLVAVRPERARRSRSTRQVAIGTLVDDAIAAVPGALERTLVAVRPPDGVAAIDPDRVLRILVNLIDNAVRHGAGAIELTAVREADTLRLEIADHGPGLPDEAARALASAAHREFRPIGPGLGLAITRGLVTALDGTIGTLPTPGGGATVRVLLPLDAPGGDAAIV